MNQLNSADKYILAASIGGTHITTAVINHRDRTLFPASIVKIEFSAKSDANTLLNSWKTALKRSIYSMELPIFGIGIATPGPFDYYEGICYIRNLNKFNALYGINIKQYFSEQLGFDPALIRFRNDAEATIAGEVLAGAGKGLKRILGITLGSGFGSAFFDNNTTRDLNLGCLPFKQHTADEILSTRWILKRYQSLSGISVSGLNELTLLARKSKILCQVFGEFSNNLAEFLKKPVAELLPEALIVYNSITETNPFFLTVLKREIETTTIHLTELSEYGALIGVGELFE